MFTAIRVRLSYANVMATLAVFAVLGGGYALGKVKGSGSLQFGGVKGIPADHYQTILKIPDLGKVQVYCGKVTVLRFKNTRDYPVEATAYRQIGNVEDGATLNGGEYLDSFFGHPPSKAVTTNRFDVFRATASGTPSADISVTHYFGGKFDECEKRAVSAQATTSH